MKKTTESTSGLIRENAERSGEKKPKWKRRIIRRVFVGFTALLLVFIVSVTIFVLSRDAWHEFDPQKVMSVSQTLYIYDKEDALTGGIYGSENRDIVSLDVIPKYVQNAFLAAEDVRFYEHNGIDIQRILGALWADLKAGGLVQGASTISMQLIKNSHLTNEKTWVRKIDEAILTLQLEQAFSKNEILEMYLNYVYFGNGAYGVEAASQVYFGKSVSQLSVAQGAMLAGILKSTSNYAPHIHLEKSITRRNLVLDLMCENGFLSMEEAEAAKQEPVVLAPAKTKYPYGFYTDTVLSEACERLGITSDELLSGGYKIYTAMDASLQKQAEDLYVNKQLFPPDAQDGEQAQSALVVLQVSSGGIAAILGGREHSIRRGLNRAIQMKRQPGSAIKPPLIFAPALESGKYSPVSLFADEPTTFADYSPKNFKNKYYGTVTLRKVISSSLNVPSVMILNELGIKQCQHYVEQFGWKFSEEDNNLSIALGGLTDGISPLELAQSYLPFANEGKYIEPYTIRKITDANDMVLYEHKTNTKQVMDKENAYVLTNMLRAVVDEGTGRRLDLDFPLAGKTGTTGFTSIEGNRDAWMVAYNQEYAACCWIGFDNPDNTHKLDASVTGGTYPALILKEVFSAIYKDKEAPEFLTPEGMIEVTIDSSVLQSDGIVQPALAPDDAGDYVEEFTQTLLARAGLNQWLQPASPLAFDLTPVDNNGVVVSFLPQSGYTLYALYRQDMDGRVTLLGEYSGITTVRVWDDAIDGNPRWYYVLPANPGVVVGGEAAKGTPSRKILYSPYEILEPPDPTSSLEAPNDFDDISPSPSATPPSPTYTPLPTKTDHDEEDPLNEM
ncbi:MAG: transglycosylase domain-containing protein [Christensenellales bacterium]